MRISFERSISAADAIKTQADVVPREGEEVVLPGGYYYKVSRVSWVVELDGELTAVVKLISIAELERQRDRLSNPAIR